MNDVESKIRRSEEVENPKDLATCNRLLLDQQRLEDQEGLKISAFHWLLNLTNQNTSNDSAFYMNLK